MKHETRVTIIINMDDLFELVRKFACDKGTNIPADSVRLPIAFSLDSTHFKFVTNTGEV